MSVVRSPPWTITEEDQLRKLAISGKMPEQIATALKRSVPAIRKRASKLKVTLALLRSATK